MSTPTKPDLNRLDQDILQARADQIQARHDWARSPNAETIATEIAATVRVNKLLEFRFSVTHDTDQMPTRAMT